VVDQARLAWQERGACRGVDPEVFFPVSDEEAWRAKEICAVCEVRLDCLAFSLANRERYGVWGGVTERERAEMFRRGVAHRVLAEALRRAG
jgi:WhiB family redox-sensing transcriptional regulator